MAIRFTLFIMSSEGNTSSYDKQVIVAVMLHACIQGYSVQISARATASFTEIFMIFLGPSRQMLG
jgi:hypothetical protein